MGRKIIIYDDNRCDAQSTKKILDKYKYALQYSVEICNSEAEIVKLCKNNEERPYLMFINININSRTRLKIAKEINKNSPKTYIVFLSDNLECVKDIYQTKHLYFVLNNELEERLPEICKKIMDIENDSNKMLRVELKKNVFAAINKKEILYLERKNRYTYIYTAEEIYETKLTFKDLDNELKETYFIRCHNSYIVSIKHIHNYRREMLLMSNNVSIPISRRYQHGFKEEFIEWMKNNGE